MKKNLVLVFFAFLLLAAPTQAKINYEAQISVDVEAENSASAREKAMREAQRQAFLEVSGRLTSEQNVETLKQLSDDEILHFVQSIGVKDEKAGGNKYKALLEVQINGPLLKDYLAENEMIKETEKNLVVIPIYKERPFTGPLLWEDNNIWRKQWQSKGQIKFGTMQLQTVRDSVGQIADLDANKSLYMDAKTYEEIAENYQTDRIYVLYAENQDNGDLKITVKSEKNKKENSFSVYNNGSDNLLDEAVEKTVMFISNMERENENEDSVGVSSHEINAVYNYTNMKDWLIKSAAINNLPQVEGLDVKSIGGGKVNFVISYTGTAEDLQSSLQELGMTYENAGSYYVIR